MSKVSILAFFILAGMLLGYFIKFPIYGTISGLLLGILVYFFIPNSKKNKINKMRKA